MLSAEEGRKQRRALERDITQSHRNKAAATLRALSAQLHAARVQRNEALARVKSQCRAERVVLSEKAHARRLKTLAELRDTYAQERAHAREACLVRKADVLAQARDPIERAKGKWEAERKYQADLRRIEQGNRERHREVHRAHAAERQSESDDTVLSNVPADYAALWKRVKHSIKGSARESRTEAFLKFVEQHPGELLSALEDDSDRLVRQLEEQRDKAERALRPPRSVRAKGRPSPAPSPAGADAVPF